jgi:hypothetical protein
MPDTEMTFTMDDWKETTYAELENGGKLTRVTMARTFSGPLTGSGVVEYLMAYTSETEAVFVGLERVTGSVAGRPGSFVMEHRGTYGKGLVKNTWTVIPGSGTGDLRGLRGDGGFESGSQKRYPMTFDYRFEQA